MPSYHNLLRPHTNAQRHWHALVILADAHRWPAGEPAYLNGAPPGVSSDL